MPVAYREVVSELVRCIITAIVIYIVLFASSVATAAVGKWFAPAAQVEYWWSIYVTLIAPLTAVVITIWLWLLENFYD